MVAQSQKRTTRHKNKDPGNVLSAPRLERGGHILGHTEKEGEGQDRGVSCRKEQVELSVRSRNRKASCKLHLNTHSQQSRSQESRRTVIQSVSPQPGTNTSYRDSLIHGRWKSRAGKASGSPVHCPASCVAALGNPATLQTIPEDKPAWEQSLLRPVVRWGALLTRPR